MLYTDTLYLDPFTSVAVASTALKSHPRACEWLLIGFSLFIVASWGIFDVAFFVCIAIVNFFAACAIVRLAGGLDNFCSR
jgi:alginate O-acetyltransferase complex protein AlgI